MARADRLERVELRRVELEAEYFEALVSALRTTAAGSWGLFNHNQDRWTQAKIAPIVASLCELAQAINRLRQQLSLDAFPLHEEFLAARAPVEPSAVGEPKRAQAWLQKLDARGAANGC